MAWKYVIFECRVEGRTSPPVRFPIIFPDKMIHLEVATVQKLVLQHMGLHVEAVSAGTIEHVGVLGLGGDSETMHLESRAEDADTIEAYSYAHGMDTPLTARVMALLGEGWRRHR